MNLFLCYTTLQLFIATRVISELQLPKDCVEVLYISKQKNKAGMNVLSEIKELAGVVNFVHMKYKYPLYFISLFRLFSRKKYSAVYLASIDNVLMHFILSIISFNKIHTFDDGTANIFPNTIFYRINEINISERIFRSVLGVHFSMEIVKGLSNIHYTIYPGYSNIIENVTPIKIFPENSLSFGVDKSTDEECNVLLGTIMSDAFADGVKIDDYVDKCICILNGTSRKVIYIPHPRDSVGYFRGTSDWTVPNADHISEVEINKLLGEYKIVHLYGFLSSCQMNIQSNSRVKNYVFYSDNQAPVLKNAIQQVAVSSNSHIEIINLDSKVKQD